MFFLKGGVVFFLLFTISCGYKAKREEILKIDRRKHSDLIFSKTPGLQIIPGETDVHSMTLSTVDLADIKEITVLKDEIRITGEEKLKRLKSSPLVRLDADILQTLWENQSLIPESWKYKVNGHYKYIFFDGTMFQASDGERYVMYLYWYDEIWVRGVYRFNFDWYDNFVSATLPTCSSLRSVSIFLTPHLFTEIGVFFNKKKCGIVFLI